MKSLPDIALVTSATGRRLCLAVLAVGLIGLVSPRASAQAASSAAPGFPPGIGQSGYHPAYPRLGLIAIGHDQTYPSTSWPTFAKFNVIVLGGNWDVWGDTRAYTREDVVAGIKRASTVGTKIFQYVDFNEHTQADTGEKLWEEAVQANNWWLYENGTSGAVVPSTYGSKVALINMTHFAPTDAATGLLPYAWAANYAYNMFYAGNPFHPRNAAPSLDGFYLDNVFAAPRADGDWNRDGTTDSHTDPAVQQWFRTGENDFFTEMHALNPGQLQIGNIGSWSQVSTTDVTAVAPLNGQPNGGVFEALIGASNSLETYAGFARAMAAYAYTMTAVAQPKLVLVNQENLNLNGSDPYNATPYQAMRYGLCLTLMNDGYYTGESRAHHSGTVSDIYWFDEYDGGGLGEGYLGQPVLGAHGVPQTGPRWTKGPLGVWAREFTGGIAIVNPKGNGPQTITLAELGGPSRWRRILGTQDPVTNDGQDVTSSITLADRDGIILLRQVPLPQPQ